MKPDHAIKLISEVRDLQIVDSEGRNCGICDDIVFEGKAGGALTVSALLVGPGAYSGRLPRWACALVRLIAGEHVVRVPWAKVDKVTSRIFLTDRGEVLGLHRTENRLRRALMKVPTA